MSRNISNSPIVRTERQRRFLNDLAGVEVKAKTEVTHDDDDRICFSQESAASQDMFNESLGTKIDNVSDDPVQIFGNGADEKPAVNDYNDCLKGQED